MVARRIDRAGRIVGRDQHDGARLRADQLGRILGGRHGAELGAEIERHRLDALHAQPHVVIEVVRTRQDHLVAGLGELISARQKAWLQPEVMPTSPGVIDAP